ncbi:MAG: hypothetical protein O2887_11760 [Bacteroidetes bacterium]|nr:hypothetical protein [Bacteroidota bacterium]MDA1121147.1 hypothetical protein [Bacteroidota bacterium]
MKFNLLLFIFCFTGSAIAQERKLPETFNLSGHPRILLLKEEEASIQTSITDSPVWEKMHRAIIEESENMIDLPPLERIQIGRRLLSVSRECIRRVFYLSYAYRMTGDESYFQKAEEEMLAISGFNDWNPTHFLDVAEMTMGMAIG